MPSVALYLLEGGLDRAAAPVFEVVPGDPEFAQMVKARRRELHRVTALLANGEVTPVQWAEQMQAILLEGHTRANYFGRMLAAQEVLESELVDVLAAQAAMDSEDYYLRGFLDAILGKDPRYWDEEAQNWMTGAIQGRQDLYLGFMRGTANNALLRETPFDVLFDWKLGLVETVHCGDCPDLAAGNPWRADELPTTPGMNQTQCLFHCACWIEREDGVIGFRPVTL